MGDPQVACGEVEASPHLRVSPCLVSDLVSPGGEEGGSADVGPQQVAARWAQLWPQPQFSGSGIIPFSILVPTQSPAVQLLWKTQAL